MRRLTLALVAASALAGCASSTANAPAPQAAAQASPSPAAPAPLGVDAARHLTGTVAQFQESCRQDIQKAQEGFARFKALPAPRDTAVALGLYDDASALLADTAGRSAIATNSHPDEALRRAAEDCEQQVAKVQAEIDLDRGVYDVLASLDLNGQDEATRHYVTNELKAFRRGGVDRDEATRAKLKALNDELIKLGQEFGRNIREDVRSVEFDPKELAGLPEDYVRAHPAGTNGKVRITTDTPDYLPFQTYAKSAKAREALWRAFRKRGHPKNLDTLSRLIAKRHEIATLLGYPSWASFITEDKMIRSDKAAAEFIEKITTASAARAKSDYDALLARKRKDEPKATVVNPWDQAYLEDRVRAEQYSFDSQAVRPYFEYTRVRQGVLDITSRMFGITYKPLPDAQVWHPDIEAYDVYEGSKLLGRIYLDMHPRADKYKHAAQWDLASGKAGKTLPEGVLMCNFPKPGAEPALMQHSDVETFFHEFGHLLHHILGGHTRWAGVSGTRTEHDFVEAPSQMLEEWAWAPESLQTFARHHQSNAPLPTETIARMKRADELGKGLWVRQQMFYAATSLRFYNRDPKGLDTTATIQELQERYTPFKYAPDTYFHLSFGHLDGYSAVYYTYMWSLVIAKDLFTPFQTEGLMNPAPALRYRRAVLEPGGAKDAAVLVKDFLGRDYGFEAYERWLNGT
ncbi:M3 family metallopeptidase [Hyalangium rubrum]|uniref:M3 family metallopeptidase n=1 Tax=Hyalangium rubrum TaxID=3103134 RepID=A0ABU5HE91_9BACT|nr:M3 family metallopeptidase [Hyalangium sp. s54d21]MDY7231801.1 M3 family metallopeptidase [Hyalangium sp. s54d21]